MKAAKKSMIQDTKLMKKSSALSESIAKNVSKNGMVEFLFTNQVVYQGQEKNGKRHGWGRQTF